MARAGIWEIKYLITNKRYTQREKTNWKWAKTLGRHEEDFAICAHIMCAQMAKVRMRSPAVTLGEDMRLQTAGWYSDSSLHSQEERLPSV